MTQPSTLFSDDDRRRINQAVAEAEARTAAEIVPVVAGASGRYDRAEDLAGLWLGLAALVAAWLLYPRPAAEPGSWSEPLAWGELVVLAAALLGGFVGGAVLASRIGGLRRLFTPRPQMAEEVARRARGAFFDRRLHHTAAASGLLLYVSLHERMAHVLADQAVFEKLGPEGLNQLCAGLTERLRQGHPAEALCQTVQECGERLAPLLPRAAGATNQLPDALVLLDEPASS